MTIDTVDSDEQSGYFTGKYNTGVGDAKGEYTLHGRYDTKGSSLGWVVCYQNEQSRMNSNSTATWSGYMWEKPGKGPTIQTTWLLTATKPECTCIPIDKKCEECQKRAERTKRSLNKKPWDRTRVGINEFTLIQKKQGV